MSGVGRVGDGGDGRGGGVGTRGEESGAGVRRVGDRVLVG